MKKQNKCASDLANLRQKAEWLVKNIPAEPHVEFSEPEALKLIHELQVHQIELEMQNEELRFAKLEAEVVSQKYAELYDLAPTGYFTLF